jgi:hypothetical protein
MADNIVDRRSPGGRPKRRVAFGDIFNSDELRDGLVELVEVEPGPQIPEEEQVEPWGLSDDAPEEKHRLFHGRLYEYVERHRHGDQ